VKLATRFEDAPDRAQGLRLLVGEDVVEHERGEHTVEGRLGIRKLIAKTLVEVDRDRRSGRLASGSTGTATNQGKTCEFNQQNPCGGTTIWYFPDPLPLGWL